MENATPSPPAPGSAIFNELRRAERAAAPPPHDDDPPGAPDHSHSPDQLEARRQRRAEREQRLAEAVREKDWDAVPEIQESILSETLPGEVSAHFADLDEFGSLGMTMHYFDPLGRAKTTAQLRDGRPVCVSVGAIEPGRQAATHPAVKCGMVVTHVEGEPVVGLDYMDIEDIMLGSRRFIMVPRQSDHFKVIRERSFVAVAAGSNATYMRRALAQSQEARETEKQRIARLVRLQDAHDSTVGRLEKMHGTVVAAGSREERLRSAAQMMKDSAIAREEHAQKRQKTPAGREQHGRADEELDDRCQDVVALCRELCQEYPDWDEAHYYLGFALGDMLGEWGEAHDEYRTVIRLNPEHTCASAALAVEERHLRQQRQDDAQHMRENLLRVVRAAYNELTVGSTVVLVDIKSQPQLNGKTGIIESVDEQKGRYAVAVDGEPKKKNLKPINLAAAGTDTDKGGIGGMAMCCETGHVVKLRHPTETMGGQCSVCGTEIDAVAGEYGCAECEDYSVCSDCFQSGVCKDTPERRRKCAAALKSAGNDAFATKDWDRSLQLYSQSVSLDGKSSVAAKTWSNLAAVLCKISYFDDALKAAEQGTICDPQWSKGWWRRGVVLCMVREFAMAAKYHERACELEPTNATFIQAAQETRKLLGVAEEPNEDGMREISPDQAAGVTYASLDGVEGGPITAWKIASQHTAGGLLGWVTEKRSRETDFMASASNPNPAQVTAEDLTNVCTSKTWIVSGLIEWVQGLKGGLVQLILGGAASTQLGRDAVDTYKAWKSRGTHSQEEVKQVEYSLFEGYSGDALPKLFCGWITLAGSGMIWIETGTVRKSTNVLLAPHPMLEGFRQEQAQQMLAITVSIANMHGTVQQIFGKNVVMPRAVQMAVDTCMANIGSGSTRTNTTAVTVESAMQYLRKQLQNGISWDTGCRQLVSCWFRGSIVFSHYVALQGMRGEAFQMLAWALDMIEAADDEYEVTTKRRFHECGSAFMPSIRRAVLKAADEMHRELRGESFSLTKGPFPINKEVEFAMKIIKSAIEHPPREFGLASLSDDVIYRRKPLTYAYGSLASLLARMPGFIKVVRDEADVNMPPRFEIGGESFAEFMFSHELLHGTHDPRNLYAVIAEYYRLAAENQLMDANDGAILWYGYAANMVRADGTRGDWKPKDGPKENTDGYTLGDLRYAITQARKAASARDVSIWGEDSNKGGSYEGQALAVCDFFANEPDSFLLPEVHIESGPSGKCQLVFQDGEPGNKTGPDVVICADFDKFMARDKDPPATWLKVNNQKSQAAATARTALTRQLEEAHGVDTSVGPQSLAVLCVRALHKAGCEFAAGAADPGEVAARLMALATNRDGDPAVAGPCEGAPDN